MSKIEWTHRLGTKSEVLNPTTGCDKISSGCKFCYAETMHKRLRGMGQPKYQQPFLGGATYWSEELSKPFKWKKPRTVFLNSMSDIFHKDITVLQIAEIYAMMMLTPQHTYIVLTKRSDRAMEILKNGAFKFAYYKACNYLHDKYIKHLEQEMYQYDEIMDLWPLKNVWQGISAENQEMFDQRVDDLHHTEAWIRVVSIEPQIGPINMFSKFESNEFNRFWIIQGGESGGKARPPHPDWFRTVRDQCKYAGIPYFFKQWGTWAPDVVMNTNEELAHVFDNLPDPGYPVQIINYEGKHNNQLLMKPITEPHIRMLKKGKHKSGNYLDGVQHLKFPA